MYGLHHFIEVTWYHPKKGAHTMKNTNVIGIDLAKNVIQICTISKEGELLSNKAISPKKLKEVLARAKPSIVAMEGCSGCHFWGRFAERHGHDVRIIGARKVKAFLQGQKTDANDALAIAVAASQVGMVFSQLKSEEQQIFQSIETTRKFLDKERIALMNHMRAFIYEYGITSGLGEKNFKRLIVDVLDDFFPGLPSCLKEPLRVMWNRFCQTVEQLAKVVKHRNSLVKQSEPCQRLKELEGVGEVCSAMLYANLGNGSSFKNGRQASAYVGVTPKQYSSGGKVTMRGINKVGGNKELRSALFQGAFSIIHKLPDKPKTTKQAWLKDLVQRVGVKRACIALANKTVRTAWALLSTGECYKATAIAY
jgi:transposase